MQSIMQSIKQAIDMEIKGESIYREIAEKSDDPFVRNTFLGLAGDEVEHARILRKYSKENSIKLDNLKDNDPKRIFGMNIDKFKKHARLGAEQLAPFDVGIKLENAGIEHYTNALKASNTNDEKKLFNILIQQENMHLEALTKAKEFLKDPQSSFQDMEGWLLDGGV